MKLLPDPAERLALDIRRSAGTEINQSAAIKWAYESRLDAWLPANGGTETPFNSRSGLRLLYCYNPATGKHAYLDTRSDTILTNEEAQYALGLL